LSKGLNFLKQPPKYSYKIKFQPFVSRIKGANLIGEQSEIDYESLYESPMYKEYIQICHQLKKVELDKLLERDPDSEEDRTGQNILAFFISILFI
jgi:hypothetical protein